MGMVFCPAQDSFSANGNTGFALLFKDWVVSDARSYSLACLGVFALGLLRQCLVGLRGLWQSITPAARAVAGDAVHEPLFGGGEGSSSRSSGGPTLLSLAVDSLFFAACLFLAYINMLVAMAYDFGLLASLVAGETVAYFLIALYLPSVKLALGIKPAAECC